MPLEEISPYVSQLAANQHLTYRKNIWPLSLPTIAHPLAQSSTLNFRCENLGMSSIELMQRPFAISKAQVCGTKQELVSRYSRL